MEHTVKYTKHVCQSSSNDSLPSVGLVPSVSVTEHLAQLAKIVYPPLSKQVYRVFVLYQVCGLKHSVQIICMSHQYPNYTRYKWIFTKCPTFYTWYKLVHSVALHILVVCMPALSLSLCTTHMC
jgi:hypothetical protein